MLFSQAVSARLFSEMMLFVRVLLPSDFVLLTVELPKVFQVQPVPGWLKAKKHQLRQAAKPYQTQAVNQVNRVFFLLPKHLSTTGSTKYKIKENAQKSFSYYDFKSGYM